MLTMNEKRAVALERLRQASRLIVEARGDTKITPKLRDRFDGLLSDLSDLREELGQEEV